MVIEVDRDPDVHGAMDDQRVAVDCGVQAWELPERVDNGAGDERQRSELGDPSNPLDLREVCRPGALS